MIFSLLFCESSQPLTSSAFRQGPLVHPERFRRGAIGLLGRFSARGLGLLFVSLFLPVFFSIPAEAQNLDNPLRSIDDEITAFSFGPNDAIAFSVYHKLKTKLYDLEHDDIGLRSRTASADVSSKAKNTRATIGSLATSSIPCAGRPTAATSSSSS